MKKHGLAVLFACLLVLGGCHVVYSTSPVGDRPVKLVSDDWEGTWTHKDGAVTVAVTDAEKGALEIGWVEKKQDRLVFEHYQVLVRQSGEWQFGNVRDPEEPRRYVWGRLRHDNDQLVLWVPSFEVFKSLVKRRIVKGRVSENGEDVILDSLDPSVLQRLTRGDDGVVLDWGRPLVFTRQSR